MTLFVSPGNRAYPGPAIVLGAGRQIYVRRYADQTAARKSYAGGAGGAVEAVNGILEVASVEYHLSPQRAGDAWEWPHWSQWEKDPDS